MKFFSHWILSTDFHKSFDLLAVELSFCWSNWLNLVCDRRWQSNGLSNHLQVFVESSCLCPKSFEQRLSRRLHLTSNLMHLVTVSRIMTDFYWLPVTWLNHLCPKSNPNLYSFLYLWPLTPNPNSYPHPNPQHQTLTPTLTPNPAQELL